MKTKVSISFDALPIPGGAASILKPAECGDDVANVRDVPVLQQIFVDIELYETDERVAKVFALLKQLGVEYRSFTYIEYSDEDRQNARLLKVWPSPDVDVFAGRSHGTEYDLTNACPNCGTGAKQASRLGIDKDGLKIIRKHRAVQMFTREILVDSTLRQKLVDAGMTGISFGDVGVRHKNGNWTEVPKQQILIEHVLPPIRGELTARDEKSLCKVCRRGGRMDMPAKPYSEEDLIGMKDFNLTWEWFGEFRPPEHRFGAHRSFPYVLVTPRVWEIFRDAGVKSMEWTPVGL